jgi:Flp pilus assembly protein TadD
MEPDSARGSAGTSTHSTSSGQAGSVTASQSHGHALTVRTLRPSVELRLFAIRRDGRQSLIAPLDRGLARLLPGEAANLDVLVLNSGVGHSWPCGDGAAKVRLEFGDRSPVEPHLLGVVAIDRAGARVKHDRMERAVARAFERRIAPGEAEIVTFRVRAPAGGVASVPVRTILEVEEGGSYRRLAEQRLQIGVGTAAGSLGGTSATTSNRFRREDSPWFLAYGHALLREGDYSAARRAIGQAVSLAPRDLRSMLMLGRVYLAEGDLIAARAQFERAASVSPGHAAPRAWLARTLRRMGQFEEASELAEQVAQEFPLDAANWFEAGRAGFQSGRFEHSASAFEQMAAISPNDPSSHLNLMLTYRRLGRLPDARREETLYQLLSSPPPAPASRRAEAAHPEWKRESVLGHIHAVGAERN